MYIYFKMTRASRSLNFLVRVVYNWTRTQNHLVLKRTLNHLAKLECGFTLKRVRDMTRTYSQWFTRLKFLKSYNFLFLHCCQDCLKMKKKLEEKGIRV